MLDIAFDSPSVLRHIDFTPWQQHERRGLTFAAAMAWIYCPESLDAARDDYDLLAAVIHGLHLSRTNPMSGRGFDMLIDQARRELQEIGVL